MLAPSIRGSGTITKESRNVSDFHAISIGGSGHATIVQGNSESLEISADDNLLPYIRSEVRNGTLKIWFEEGNLRFSQSPQFRFEVKTLDRVDLSGALSADIRTLETDELDARISGSGKINVDRLNAQSLSMGVSGSGSIRIDDGKAESFHLRVSGSGDAVTDNFQVDSADISISGSGSAKVWALKSLAVEVSGSGRVDYRGEPQVSSHISGSGAVRQIARQ
jgi:hypothetical protein